MYSLSANSQNIQDRIDSLCLEEPFRNAPSGSAIWRPPFHSGESQGPMPKSLGDRPEEVLGGSSQYNG